MFTYVRTLQAKARKYTKQLWLNYMVCSENCTKLELYKADPGHEMLMKNEENELGLLRQVTYKKAVRNYKKGLGDRLNKTHVFNYSNMI